jgi:hypothetical protein
MAEYRNRVQGLLNAMPGVRFFSCSGSELKQEVRSSCTGLGPDAARGPFVMNTEEKIRQSGRTLLRLRPICQMKGRPLMTRSISGPVSVQPVDIPAPAPAATRRTPQPQSSVDTVTLSQSAQIIQMNQQGQISSQIAANLGIISVSTVDSDLGIAAAAVSSKPSAAPVVVTPPPRAPQPPKLGTNLFDKSTPNCYS